jgi:hypothetical protein
MNKAIKSRLNASKLPALDEARLKSVVGGDGRASGSRQHGLDSISSLITSVTVPKLDG